MVSPMDETAQEPIIEADPRAMVEAVGETMEGEGMDEASVVSHPPIEPVVVPQGPAVELFF